MTGAMDTDREAVLTVRHAEKRYGSTQALAGVDLTLARGRWLGLLGPNGAGKTTLVRAIAGRVRLDAGRITLHGAELGPGLSADSPAARQARRRLGVVPQELALYERLTASENLTIFGELHGVTGRTLRERVAWALAWSALADRARDRVSGFSGGMKRRLNIACSVLHEPDVVLLDEPTVGVDPQSRARIWEMLEALRARGTALLLTTHHLDEAQEVCEEIVIVDHGRVVAAGALDALIADTLGARRSVVLGVQRVPGHAPVLLDAPSSLDAGDAIRAACAAEPGLADLAELEVDGAVVRCTVGEVATALPALLHALHAAGFAVGNIEVSAPRLHALFLHLTGQELRE
jgi:ABC-2 type transport system ATP-binding protein